MAPTLRIPGMRVLEALHLNEPLETGAGLEMVDGLRPFMCRQEQRGAGD